MIDLIVTQRVHPGKEDPLKKSYASSPRTRSLKTRGACDMNGIARKRPILIS